MGSLVYWSIALVVLFVGIYLMWDNARRFQSARKAKQTFLANHRDSRIEVTGQVRTWTFAILGVLCLGFALTYFFSILEADPDVRNAQIVIYLGLTLFCFGMALESLTLGRLAISPDGFMAADEYVKYKTIATIEQPKGFMKGITVLLRNGQAISLPKADGLLIERGWSEYRNRSSLRKGKKKRA